MASDLRKRFMREMALDSEPCKLCTLIVEAEEESPPPDHTCKEHIHYHAKTMETSADACYKASLELIFAHVADIHMIILKVLSAKYGHSIEEMLNTVTQSPEWKNIYLHPVLKTLVYFENLTTPDEPEKATTHTIRRKKKKE